MQIILADNQAIFCAGTFRVLTSEPAIRVVAQCSDEDQIREAMESFGRSIVIFPSSITTNLHGLLDCIQSCGSRSVMILEQGGTLEESINQRLDGIAHRSVGSRQLVDCVNRVSGGGRYVQPGMLKMLMFPSGARGAHRLTPRELQIVGFIAEGCRNREIADQLGTREQVVKNHLRNIYGKMGVSDRLELALVTVRHRGLAETAEAARLSLARSA